MVRARRLSSVVRRNAAMRRIAFILATLIFGGGLVASFQARPEFLEALSWRDAMPVLALYAAGVVLFNTIAFLAVGRLATARLAPLAAFRVTVLSSALNHLPFPGGPLLRIAALKDAGASLSNAASASLSYGGFWAVGAFALAALGAGAFNQWTLCFFLMLVAIVATVPSALLAKRCNGSFWGALPPAAMGLVAAMLYAAGVWFAFRVLGVAAPWPNAFLIAVAGVIGNAVSLAPAGLGVRETAASAIAVASGFDPAASFAATALLHLMSAGVLALAASALAATPGAGSLRARPL